MQGHALTVHPDVGNMPPCSDDRLAQLERLGNADRLDRDGLSFFHSVIWDKLNPGLAVGIDYALFVVHKHRTLIVSTGRSARDGAT